MSGTTSGTTGTFPPDTGIRGTGTREAQLTRLYDTVFDRAPDSGGLAFWTAFLNRGGTLDTVADLLVRSPEFQGRGALGNADFVSLMYRNGLEREADAPGLSFWTGGLQGTAIDRGGVALAISETNEGVASSLARGTGAAGAGTGTATQTADGSTGTGAGTTSTDAGSAGTGSTDSDTTGTGTQTTDGSTGTTGTGTGAQTASADDTGTGLGDDTPSDSVRIRTPDGELLTVRVVGEDLPVGSEVVDIAADGAPDAVVFLDDGEEAALLSSPEWFMV